MSLRFDSRGALVSNAFEPTPWLGHLPGWLSVGVRYSEETHRDPRVVSPGFTRTTRGRDVLPGSGGTCPGQVHGV